MPRAASSRMKSEMGLETNRLSSLVTVDGIYLAQLGSTSLTCFLQSLSCIAGHVAGHINCDGSDCDVDAEGSHVLSF